MFKAWVIELLSGHIENPQLEVPPNEEFGDYAVPCFSLAKKFKKSPVEIAKELAQKIQPNSKVKKITAVGPYLNFTLNEKAVSKALLKKILEEKESYGSAKQGKKIVIEYCGPNTNKPLHLGHLRNMALGLATCKILDFLGNKVIPVNIVNDRGIHICKSMLAYKKWGNNKEPDKKGDHFVGDFYVIYAQHEKEDESLAKEAQDMLIKWEQGDKQTREIWKKMNTWVLEGFAQTFKRFGVEFDKEYHESEYYAKGKELADEGVKKGVFEVDETKAVIAPLEQFKLPNKVVLRGDQTSIYITQDMYLANLRYEDYQFDKMIYVVASEQNLHFSQLFKILELLEKPFAKNCFHLSYGMVHLPSGRMKSREGTVVDADDLLDEVVNMAKIEIKQRHQDIVEDEVNKRAEEIGVSSIKFFLLKIDSVHDMIFNPEESLSFEGETGPYVQYSHARACSILRKKKQSSKPNVELLAHPMERSLLMFLSKFPKKIEEAGAHYKPHIVCRYVIDLARMFNEFYHHPECKVISEDVELTNARLELIKAIRQTLANGLHILGLDAPEEM